MDLVYEQGDTTAPRGHAVLYFQQAGSASLLATYVVVLPIPIDLLKYMPPFLAPHLSGMNTGELSAFAFPPVPEPLEDLGRMQALAAARGDDLLFGGDADASRVPDLLSSVNAIVQAYAQAYLAHAQSLASQAPAWGPEAPSELGVAEVLYELMGDRDRLADLARLVAKLRFAVEGDDRPQIDEAEYEVRTLAKFLPAQYDVESLLAAAKDPTRLGGELAQLYLERCYKLTDKDDDSLLVLDERIRALREREESGAP